MKHSLVRLSTGLAHTLTTIVQVYVRNYLEQKYDPLTFVVQVAHAHSLLKSSKLAELRFPCYKTHKI